MAVAVTLAVTGNKEKLPACTPLPFTGPSGPDGVAVDSNGTVYVTDVGHKRVVALAAGSTSQTVLPFTGLQYTWGVAVDRTDTIYVTDNTLSRVMKLAAAS